MLRRSLVAAVVLAALGCARPYAPLPGPQRTLDEPGCARERDPAALGEVLRRADAARAAGRRPVAIFDLDGTLVDPTPRTLAIFAAALGAIASPEARAARARIELALATRPLERYPYAPDDILARFAVAPELRPPVLEAWRRDFFSNAYLSRDEPIPGAPVFVRALRDRGARVIYLTGRSAASMREGTADSLRRLGFPLEPAGAAPGSAELRMKPDGAMDDRTFKRAALDDVAATSVVAVFENEPGNLRDLAERFPQAVAVFVGSSHSPGAPPVPSTARCVADLSPP